MAEPQERGAIIRYSLEFPQEGAKHKLYRFAAIKGPAGKWFTTGSTCPEDGWTWDDLLAEITDKAPKTQRYYDVIWPVPTMTRVYV